jgi:DNA modification methylase
MEAWAKKIGLPDEAIPILDTGLCYVPKPGHSEKSAGLDGDNEHPTSKPISLLAYYITMSTQEGARVLDPFNGSGSTGVAAAFLGREYTGVELDPDHIATSEARIQHVLDRGAICYEEVVSTDIDDEQETF